MFTMAQNTAGPDLIQSPGWRQASQVFLLFVVAMLFANALFVFMESKLGLYSYFAAAPLQQLQWLSQPLQWVCRIIT
jgi:hypothetical protein